MQVVVAIGDVVASRQSPNRKALQRQLATVVSAINRYSREGSPEALLSPYTITLGDEVQCVYASPAMAILDVIAFKSRMLLSSSPGDEPSRYEMRFCIGVGELTTTINRRAAIGMDGPAFHCAREGIDELKKDGTSTLAVKAQPGIDVSLEDSAVKLIGAAMHGWRPTRFMVLLAMMRGHDVKTISNDLGVSAAAVYKNLTDGRIPLLTNAAKATGRSLQRRIDRTGTNRP